MQGILKQEPQFLTGRQLLRRTEVTRLKSAKKKFFNVSTASVAVMKAQREMKKDAKRAVELIEKILGKRTLQQTGEPGAKGGSGGGGMA